LTTSSVNLRFLKRKWLSLRLPDRSRNSFSFCKIILSNNFPAVFSIHKGRNIDGLVIGLSDPLCRRRSLARFYPWGNVDSRRLTLYVSSNMPGEFLTMVDNISLWIPFGPGALPLARQSAASLSSSMVSEGSQGASVVVTRPQGLSENGFAAPKGTLCQSMTGRVGNSASTISSSRPLAATPGDCLLSLLRYHWCTVFDCFQSICVK